MAKSTGEQAAAVARRTGALSDYGQVHDVLSVSIQSGVPVLLIGPPGAGKSAMARAVAHALGRVYLSARLGQMERGDLAGFPVPYVDATTGLPRSAFVPGPVIQEAAAAAAAGLSVVVNLDELSHTEPSLQTAAMSVVYDRYAGSVRLPGREQLAFVATGNGADTATGGAGVGYKLTGALANRVSQVRIDRPSAAEWRRAKRAGWQTPTVRVVDPERLAEASARIAATLDRFFDAFPQLDYALPQTEAAQSDPWPSHRSWEEGERALAYAEALGLSLAGDTILAGIVGEAAAAAARTFLDEAAIPSVADLLAGRAPLPSRDDAYRIALDTCVAAGVRAHTERAPDAATVIGSVVALLVAAAGARPALVVPPASRLQTAIGSGTNADLSQLMVDLKPTINRLAKKQ